MRRKSDWLEIRPPSGRRFTNIKSTLRDRNLNTVREGANCSNLGECWSGRNDPEAATFMLTGDRCLRGCNSCDVTTGGMEPLDFDEPANVADAVTEVGLDYVVLTSMDRNDLPNQGAAHFVETVRETKRRDPEVLVEVLIPGFRGDPEHVWKIIDAGPGVIAHDIEAVERLQWPIRDRHADYEQSPSVFRQVTDEPDIHTRTSVMLGLGEHAHEAYRTLSDLREADVDIVTFDQYLQPSQSHLDVFEYIRPDAFETWRRVAKDELGFLYCVSGPMVRSPYKTGELFVDTLLREGSNAEEARQTAHAAAGQ